MKQPVWQKPQHRAQHKVVVYLLFFVVSIATSCSTTKNTWIRRAYHNTTSYYNILFNGKEAYKKGILQISTAYKDDYTQILPIYPFGSPECVQAGLGSMDKAIQKASKLIDQHSIKVKPKIKKNKTLSQKERDFFKKTEYNKWVDDAYLIMGKSYFHELEFDKAAVALQTVNRKFANTESDFIADLWLWRNYSQKGDYVQAERYMALCKDNKVFRNKYPWEMSSFEIDFLLKQKQYEPALKLLEKSIQLAPTKAFKARIYYIIAQLHLREPNYKKAQQYFELSAKKSDNYELTFNARIQQAIAFDSGATNYESLMAQLRKMAHDDINSDLLDQIYFVMASISAKANKHNEAKKFYIKCLEVGGQDAHIRTQAFLALADVYFQEKKYQLSGAYYDSTMVSLSEKQENYTQIAEKAKNLIILAKSLNTIQIEDSLQALSRLDEAALTQVIQQKIQAYQQAQNKKNASNPNDNNFMLQDRDNSQNQQTFSGSWYFYNPAALSYGDTEFKRKWGNRTLSDHWRRRDKTIQEENSEQETTEQDPKNLNTDPSKKEYYLQNIKKTAADFDASDKKIREALFAAGNIYYDFINEKTEAKNIYNQIIKRFPQSEEALESLYRQYIMAYEAKQNKEAEAYKNEIIGRFPESSRAKSLKDPNYLERQRNARGYSETNYAQAFEQYNRGQYQQSLNILNTALAEYPDNHLGAKMRLLSAMNNGKQQLLPQYIDGLRLVIKNYPTGPEAQLAKDMLVVAEKGRISGKPIGQIYANHPTDLQQAAIWLKADKAQVGQIKFEIAKFNGTYDQRTNFSISEYPMQQGYLLAIRPFANQTDAQNYLLKILATPNLKQYLSDTPSFSIDQTNLETLGKDKDPQLYLEYLNKP